MLPGRCPVAYSADGAGVDHQLAPVQHLGHPFGRERDRAGQPSQGARSRPVDALHGAEVFRWVRLALEHQAHELRLVGDAEGPVEAALVAHRAVGNRAHPLAARGARSMARPDLEVVGLGLEALDAAEERPRRRLHRAPDPRRPLEQVGAADVAHEDEVSGHRRDGLGGRRAIGDEKGEVLRGVTRSMEDLHADPSHGEPIAVAHTSRRRRPRRSDRASRGRPRRTGRASPRPGRPARGCRRRSRRGCGFR